MLRDSSGIQRTIEDFKERYISKFNNPEDAPDEKFILFLFVGLSVFSEINYNLNKPIKRRKDGD